MNLSLNYNIAANYHNKSQIARILTETWTAENLYCPRCGNSSISKLENNTPVADFYCPKCNNFFEQKSQNGNISIKVNDGAYSTMLQRITSNTNPDFLFMSYDLSSLIVKSLFIVPKHFFVPTIIEKRKPLAPTARRGGWIGCNILLNKIPDAGKIYMINKGNEIDKKDVLYSINKTNFLSDIPVDGRGWLLDIMNCIQLIPSDIFDLSQMYSFEERLKYMHPNNCHIKDKIRQQLQILRDKDYIEFLGKGRYKKNEFI